MRNKSQRPRKMAQVKERGGGGEERKETFPSFLSTLSFFGSRFISRALKPKSLLPRSFLFRNQTETLATQAKIVTAYGLQI